MKNIIVYTDGSCMKSKYSNKCGYGVHFFNNELDDISRPFTHEPLTNQRAELYAIYKALYLINKHIKDFDSITIYSDSRYSIMSITTWIHKWKENNWMISKNKPVKNQDIIKKIDRYMEKYKNKITFHHVKSHTGKQDTHSLHNEIADKLATSGALNS